MGFSTTSSENMAALKDALGMMEPGDFILARNDTIDNWAIGVGSQCPYGHAILYMGEVGGKKSCLEMPILLAPTSKVLAKDNCLKAMFVHCRRLSDRKREIIVEFAKAYYDASRDSLKKGFDIGGFMQGAGSIAIGNTLGSAVGWASEDAERVVRNVAEAPNAVVNELIVEFLTKYPALTCAGLVGWCHWQAKHLIDDSHFAAPHTTSPRALWSAVKAEPDRFKALTYNFD